MQILLATSNPYKLNEILSVFRTLAETGKQVPRLMTLEAIGLEVDEPVEDQPTFEGNAQLKAQYYADCAQLPCLADDSGLEVDALSGEPGVLSARYSGATGAREDIDQANNLHLLTRLGETPTSQRAARFVCAMALCYPAGNSPAVVVRGTIEGRILGPGDQGWALDNPKGRGKHGFGYDPLFLLPDRDVTTAELTPVEKNAVSHRGCASRLMWQAMHEQRD